MNGPEVPPPSPALLARMGDLRPVRTRRPIVDAALVAGGSIAATVALLLASRVRYDAASPVAMAVAAVCAVAFGIELWWAVLRRGGQVLRVRPGSGVRVAVVWALTSAALVAAGHDWGLQ